MANATGPMTLYNLKCAQNNANIHKNNASLHTIKEVSDDWCYRSSDFVQFVLIKSEKNTQK